jgi:signal transduction histidine kinase
MRATVDLKQLVARMLDLLAPQVLDAQLRLERTLCDTPPVAIDEPRLQQVIVNLVLNAVQATPAGGWIRVVVRPDGADLVFSVEDSGPGVPDGIRERIFEPFFTTKDAGSGLGLPLVHSIVQQHGGNVVYERGEVGGARFVVRLPIRPNG